jgi:hypothetical protein
MLGMTPLHVAAKLGFVEIVRALTAVGLTHHARHATGCPLNSVSGLVSNIWYRIPFDQSELSIARIPLSDSPTVRPGRDP